MKFSCYSEEEPDWKFIPSSLTGLTEEEKEILLNNVVIERGLNKLEYTVTVKEATKANDGSYGCYGKYNDIHFAAIATLEVIGN